MSMSRRDKVVVWYGSYRMVRWMYRWRVEELGLIGYMTFREGTVNGGWGGRKYVMERILCL
jgi:hypothetical protein